MNAATDNTSHVTKSLEERRVETRAAIKRQLEALGHSWQEHDRERVTVDGVDMFLRMPEESTGSYSSRRGTGRLRLKFGDYGKVQQFPEPKAGFDAQRIANAISAYVKGKVEQWQAIEVLRCRRDANQALADAINKDLGLRSIHEVRADVNQRSGNLQVRIVQSCTEQVARALLAAAKKILTKPAAQ